MLLLLNLDYSRSSLSCSQAPPVINPIVLGHVFLTNNSPKHQAHNQGAEQRHQPWDIIYTCQFFSRAPVSKISFPIALFETQIRTRQKHIHSKPASQHTKHTPSPTGRQANPKMCQPTAYTLACRACNRALQDREEARPARNPPPHANLPRPRVHLRLLPARHRPRRRPPPGRPRRPLHGAPRPGGEAPGARQEVAGLGRPAARADPHRRGGRRRGWGRFRPAVCPLGGRVACVSSLGRAARAGSWCDAAWEGGTVGDSGRQDGAEARLDW